MAKPFKIFLIVVGVLLLLIVGAIGAAVALFDPNDYRGKVTALVKDQTGRDLTIGNIGLSVFPWLNVQLDDVTFSNAPGFGTNPMAQVGKAAVGVQLMPLLFDKEVKVSTVHLEGLKLDLAKDATGRSNWDDLVKKQDEKPKDDKEKNSSLKSIDIAGVTLKDADIAYRDDQARQAYHLTKVNITTGALRPGDPFDIDASLSALAEAQKASADVKFSSTVLLDLVGQKVKADKLELDVKAQLPGKNLATNLSADVVANLETQVVAVDGLKADFSAALPDMKAEGSASGKVLADLRKQLANVDGLKVTFKSSMKDMEASGSASASVKAALATQVFELGGLTLDANASGAAIPGGKQSAKVTGNLTYDAAKGAMRFSNGKLAAAGLDVTTSIEGSGLTTSAPRLSGPIAVAPFNPRTLLTSLGQADIKTADEKVLTRASFSANYSGSFDSSRLDNLKLQLDDTNANGSFAVKNFATQALEFALAVDRIDADRYLAPPEKTPQQPAAKPEEVNKTQLPVDAINKLNASGTLDVRELKLKGATLKDVKLRIDGPKGSPKVVKLDAQTFGGTMSTSSTIGPGAAPTFALDTTISSVSLSPLVQTFVGKDIISGLGNIKLGLTTSGATVGDVRRGLNGDVSLNFQNGAMKGFNLGQILRQGQALLKGQQYTANEPQETDFTSISLAAKIVNGVLKTDQLAALSPLFRLTGSGDIDLANETINYLASPTVVGSAQGQGGKGLEDLAGLTIPIRLTGSLRAPKYKLDLQTALKQKGADELRGKLADKVLGGDSSQGAMSQEEFRQKSNEKIGKELSKGLDKLFGKKKAPSSDATAPAASGASGTTTAPSTTAPAAAPAPEAAAPPKAEEKPAEAPPPAQ